MRGPDVRTSRMTRTSSPASARALITSECPAPATSPGQPGGYDPVAGTIGTAGLTQPGGSFNLNLVADVADAPTRVTDSRSSRLIRSPPPRPGSRWPSPAPSTRPVSWANGSGQPAVVAVDQAGKSWALTPISYSEPQCQVSFVFDQALPAGQYTLRLPATGGLTDLAGKAPIAPGLSAGVLASWTVAAPRSTPMPNDLGVLWPSLVDGSRARAASHRGRRSSIAS